MKINDVLHGFRVTKNRFLPEIDGTVWEMVYEKNGAQLIWLDRADTNKTFAIAFKTIPEDSTGVFHIIEHSVLCGSEKYPVKDPFVELLKGSMQTFLNAFTFNDKTMYPVSSRNEKDFLNLMDVYLDAVLHPQILHKPEIFYQEGWHYELSDENAAPTYKGVVFNEMKGAYSSVDEVMEEEAARLMFPDNCYGKDSGGDPTVIPALTYKQFLACHKRYYHPSNARIILDGQMDLDAALAKIDSFLAPYDKLDVQADIPMQQPLPYREVTREYEISETESEENKTRLCFCFGGFPYDDQKNRTALSLLTSVLCGSNETPLTKALLERGLCEDVFFSQVSEIQQSFLTLEIRNTSPEKIEEVKNTVRETLEAQIAVGIDREKLTACLNQMEFRLRERDFATFPRGLVYAMSSLETWLYGGDPTQNLTFNDTLAFLREALQTDFYENLLRRAVLENPHRALLILNPSKTLAARRIAEENDRLAKARASWTKEDVARVLAENEALRKFQSEPDTPEAIATLPRLSLSDIQGKPEDLPTEEHTIAGVSVYHHPVATDGILYADLYFGINDATREELPALSLLASLFQQMATEQRSALDVQNLVKYYLGALNVGLETFGVPGDAARANLYLRVSVSVLEANRDKVADILKEILTQSLFTDKAKILNVIRQIKTATQESFGDGGHAAALARTLAYTSSSAAAHEYAEGYEGYLWLKAQEASFDKTADTLCETLAALAKKYFCRERLHIGLTGAYDEAFLTSLTAALPTGGVAAKQPSAIAPLGVRQEGLTIPSQVGYAVLSAHLGAYNGAVAVAQNLLSFEYLWMEVRVKGGAYGGGMIARATGDIAFYSYRDPDACRTLETYTRAAAFLRQFAEGSETLDKFIIGAVASSEPLLSPRLKGMVADTRRLRGTTYADICRWREEMLATDKSALLRVADAVDEMVRQNAVCVIGGADKLAACGDKLQNILTL